MGKRKQEQGREAEEGPKCEEVVVSSEEELAFVVHLQSLEVFERGYTIVRLSAFQRELA